MGWDECGRGSVVCMACSGRGSVVCTACSGCGSVVCVACGGGEGEGGDEMMDMNCEARREIWGEKKGGSEEGRE